MTSKAAILDAVARLLDDEDVATYRPDGGYLTDEVAVVFKTTPPEPDRCVTLTVYDLPVDHLLGLQVRCRGRVNQYLDADDLAEQVQNVLHGLRGLTFDAVTVELVAWQSGGGLGLDDNGRDETTATYHLTVNRPGPSLVDITT